MFEFYFSLTIESNKTYRNLNHLFLECRELFDSNVEVFAWPSCVQMFLIKFNFVANDEKIE